MLYVALTTVSKKSDAERLARLCVAEGAAACVNIIPGVASVYFWKGKLCRGAEWLLVIKTTKAALPRLKRLLAKHHPYDVHELAAWPVKDGNPAYLRWAEGECRSGGQVRLYRGSKK